MPNTNIQPKEFENNHNEKNTTHNKKTKPHTKMTEPKPLTGNRKRALFKRNRVNSPKVLNETKQHTIPSKNHIQTTESQDPLTNNVHNIPPNKRTIRKTLHKKQPLSNSKRNIATDSEIKKNQSIQTHAEFEPQINSFLSQTQRPKPNQTEKFERDKLARKINELNQKDKHCFYVYEDKLRPQLISTKYELAKKSNTLFYSALDNKLNTAQNACKNILLQENKTEQKPEQNNKPTFIKNFDDDASKFLLEENNQFKRHTLQNSRYTQQQQEKKYNRTKILPPPKDGIKIRNNSNIKNWWTNLWLDNIEQYIHSPQLMEQAKQYAKDGHITQIAIDKGQIKALVQGSRLYSLNIKFSPLKEKAWHIIGRVLGSQAELAARLLNGELPEEVNTALIKAGFSLIPQIDHEFQPHCSCANKDKICKHVLAVYYLLSEEIENHPLLLLKLRGKERRELISLILNNASRHKDIGGNNNFKQNDEITEAEEQDNNNQTETKPQESSLSKILNTCSEPLPTIPDLFWGKILSIQALPTFETASAPKTPDAILNQLGTFPFWRGDKDLNQELSTVYQLAVKENDDSDSLYA
ncbi:hypothetical protein [Desulfovibrio litoralis]|uniref:Uncharacterized conserved protein, contains Zn finger domain n=1 Tax=Desulfovibrio litoralis DSM 11393 TaxID=1121455 RepID=A0A1M7SQX0_9BACT|nr:hypothetical protein [Desulfovibrio litoralis]SHN60869.1 Uncharacterized conserved protein, contains Zn finger domain [Desulfovibrio litoralis DSM 11393]